MKKTILSAIIFCLVSAVFGQATDPNTTDSQPPSRDIPGFDGISWGTRYANVKQRFIDLMGQAQTEQRVEIISDTPDREIIVQRAGILYKYSFYKNPAPRSEDPNAEENNPRFFYAESAFPLVPSEDLHSKLVEKYGERTASSRNKDNRGAYIWTLPNGYLVQWVEPYEKGSYTRRLSYLSKTIRDEINTDIKYYQYKKELAALEAILP